MLRLINYFDLFGTQILFRFRGKQFYKTTFGTSLTIIISVIILIRFSVIIADVQSRKEPLVIYKERSVLNPEIQKMTNSTIHFAFGMQDPITFNSYIDPNVYTIRMRQFTKKTFFNETTQKLDAKYSSRDIKIGNCVSDNFQNKDTRDFFMSLKYQNMYCMDPNETVEIEGDFNSDTFSYYTIRVMKCKGPNCKSQPEMDALLKKGFFSIFTSDVTVDPVEKDNPFKYFSRDFYWMTSTELPSDILVYYRNNYVESDYGWINSDVSVQRHAQFSTTQNQYLPPSFDQYYFQVTVRFEKQKESLYQRKYKSLTQIISEIGGFAQALLAVGFILCTRLSQLDLSKTIINDAFDFQIDNKQKSNNKLEKKNSSSTVNVQQNKTSNLQKSQGGVEMVDASIMNQHPIFNGNLQSNQNTNMNISVMEKDQLFLAEKKTNSPTKLRDCSFYLQKVDSNNANKSNNYFQNQQQQQNKRVKYKKNLSSNNSQILLSSIIQNKKVISQDQGNVDGMNMSSPKKVKSIVMINQQEITENKFKKLLKSTTNSMKLSTWEYIKYFFWPFGEIKKKKQIIDYSFQRLYQHLDVLNVIKKLLEVDKLKRLLMDNEQIKLFDYLPKPTIKEEHIFRENQQNDNINEYDILYQDNRTEIQKLQDAYKAYVNLKNREEKSYIDKKIMNLLDPNLLNLFNLNVDDRQENQDQEINKLFNNYKINEVSAQNAVGTQLVDDTINSTGLQALQQCIIKQNTILISPLQIDAEIQEQQDQPSASDREIPNEDMINNTKDEESKQNVNMVIQNDNIYEFIK